MNKVTEKNKVTAQNRTITDLQAELNEANKTIKDTTKYLVNVDRNSRQHNAVMFGVSENELHIQEKDKENAIITRDDSQKVKELLKIVQYEGEVKQIIRLGKKGDRPRPIKLIFDTP